ncbi:ribonuclease H2, subunit C [Boeremia exigua]|uniref:ribonuclease H2, subunit C n=1 Tax=Boeremia exigua TaxID=749465 RepID=UPI001E8DBC32|nr:ribonuclease H2, subunit C [Boeremia exigua]KAH6614267.1 ribonuclease H2, subunit C [Boeremia exigua]
MLSIPPSTPKKCTPNLLPMRINHNGRIDNTARYWTPTTDEKGTLHTHFRGRHLHGTLLALPATHTGAVLRVTDKPAQASTAHNGANGTHGAYAHDDAEDGDDEMDDGGDVVGQAEDVKIAEQLGEFSELVVWGHGGVVDEGDAFVRGMREWVGFAGVMHCDEDGGVEGKAS